MRPIIERSATFLMRSEHALKLMDIGEGLFVYHLSRQSAPLGSPEGSVALIGKGATGHLVETSGVVDAKGRAQLERGEHPGITGLCFLDAATLEAGRRQGWSAITKQLDAALRVDLWEAFVADPALSALSLVRVSTDSHMIFDATGVPLPLAHVFSYIDSGIDEGNYDLGAAAQSLLDRMDVLVYSRATRDFEKPGKLAAVVADAIREIPSYNQDENHTQTIEFLWAPSRADYVAVWEKAKELSPQFPSTQMEQATIAVDVLGLKEFRYDEDLPDEAKKGYIRKRTP